MAGEELAAGAPQRPALDFCFAMSAIVGPLPGVPVFLMPVPASRSLNASPPDRALVGFAPIGDFMPEVEVPAVCVEGDGVMGTEVK
mgnify:CR=1 FL=1